MMMMQERPSIIRCLDRLDGVYEAADAGISVSAVCALMEGMGGAGEGGALCLHAAPLVCVCVNNIERGKRVPCRCCTEAAGEGRRARASPRRRSTTTSPGR